jgi:transposase
MMAPLVRRSWSPSGQTPILHQRTRSHQKVSVIGALAISPTRSTVRCYFRLLPNENFTAQRIVDFLYQLESQIKAPMVIVWDRLQAHRGKLVQSFLRTHPEIRTTLLPAYAPELNPIEHGWGYLKTNPMANLAPSGVDHLASTARQSLWRMKRNQSLLQSFINHSPLSLCLK